MKQTTLSGIYKPLRHHFVRAAVFPKGHAFSDLCVLACCAPSVHLAYSYSTHKTPHSKHFLLKAFPDSS